MLQTLASEINNSIATNNDENQQNITSKSGRFFYNKRINENTNNILHSFKQSDYGRDMWY